MFKYFTETEKISMPAHGNGVYTYANWYLSNFSIPDGYEIFAYSVYSPDSSLSSSSIVSQLNNHPNYGWGFSIRQMAWDGYSRDVIFTCKVVFIKIGLFNLT